MAGEESAAAVAQRIWISMSADVRAQLLSTDLTSATRDALERPFDMPLTATIAEELLRKCRELGLDQAAELMQMALVALATVHRG